MTITNETLLDLFANKAMLEEVRDMQMFGSVRFDGDIGDIYCYQCSHKQFKDPDYDCVELLDVRRDDKCCVCGRGRV